MKPETGLALAFILLLSLTGALQARDNQRPKHFLVITRNGVDGHRGGVQRFIVEAHDQNQARALAESQYGGHANVSDVRPLD